MAKKKKSTIPDLSKVDPLDVIDVTKLGMYEYDPCFGKGYNLSTKECKLCGDSELCALKMAQVLKITRKELEEKNHYKDLDTLEDVEGIKKYMRSLKRKGLTRKEIVSKCNTKFEVPKKDLRIIFKQLK